MPETAESNRPLVGVGVIIHDHAGNIIMGQRTSSHGTGTFQLPGGHLEYGESFAAAAAREALEETGLEIGNVRFLTATNDVFVEGGKHYVTVFVVGEIVGAERVARVMEPLKCAGWEWVPWRRMWAWAGEQARAEKEGRTLEKRLFLPLVHLCSEYPDLKDALIGW